MLSLSGCFNSDECIETICQAEALVEQWQIDPVAAEAALLATTDPIIQIATLRALSEHQPAALSALCPKLSELPARECQQLSGRPHLWDSGSGAVSSLPIEGLVNPWADLPPQEVDCADDSCRLTAALAAGNGAGVCASVESVRWRQECFFRLAEQARDAHAGARLCLGAGQFADRCLGHISKHLAHPSTALNDAAGWQALTATVDEIAAVLPEALGERMADRIYAESLFSAYVAAESLTGDPLDHLPQRARPHIYAALAHRLMTEQSLVGLRAWEDALESALERRGAPGTTRARPGGIPNSWKTLLPGEEAIPWVAYLRDQRRAQGSTPETDRLITLLEANARRSRPDRALINEAMRSVDPLVRWTVARTIDPNYASGALHATLRADSDPLVQQRAQHHQTR